MRITIVSVEFTTEVCKEIDEFIFLVVMFTFPLDNIPIQLGYVDFLIKLKIHHYLLKDISILLCVFSIIEVGEGWNDCFIGT